MNPSNFTNSSNSEVANLFKNLTEILKPNNSSSEALLNPLKSELFITLSALAILSSISFGIIYCRNRIGRRQSLVNVPMADFSPEAGGGRAEVDDGSPTLRGIPLVPIPRSTPSNPRSSSTSSEQREVNV